MSHIYCGHAEVRTDLRDIELVCMRHQHALPDSKGAPLPRHLRTVPRRASLTRLATGLPCDGPADAAR